MRLAVDTSLRSGLGRRGRLERGADVRERRALGDVATLRGGRPRGARLRLSGLARLVLGDRALTAGGRRGRRALGRRTTRGRARGGAAASSRLRLRLRLGG